MLKKVIITNYLGETAEYKIEGVQSDDASGLFITSVEGLGPVKASINMLDLATTDGQLYNSARLSGRNIVIKARFTDATSIEEARLLSYKYFPIKSKVNIKVVTDNRIGETDGYVESNEPDIFSDQSGCQISILCENPYFDGGKIGYTFGDTVPLFKFQFGNEDLDEPLIKISEDADVNDVREIVYEGDTDAGMEIAVEVPSDDIMDTFKVTGIEIQGDKGSIKIDTSKMVNQVPNSAPYQLDSNSCTFGYRDETYKFLQAIPERSTDYGKKLLVYRNELYLFLDRGTDAVSFYKFNRFRWDYIGVLPDDFLNDVKGLVVYNDLIHAIGLCGDRSEANPTGKKHYVYDGSTWTDIGEPPSQFRRTKNVVFNNKIYIIEYRLQELTAEIYTYDESGWNKIISSIAVPFNFNGASILVYNDAIHILGSSNSSDNKKHCTFNGSSFTENVSTIIDSFEDGGAVVYDGCIHLFGIPGKLGPTIVPNGHCKWDGVTWERLSNPPAMIKGDAILYDSTVILVSDDIWTSSYTEEANNIKLIENDKLVINTIKGKKGVTLYRGTNSYNVLNALDKDSTWLQLQRGVNRFSYTAEEGADDMQITISTNKWYEGV